MSIAEKLTTIAENEHKVYEAGQKDHNKALWESMKYEAMWFYTFAGQYWNDTTFNPTIDLIVPYVSGMFFRSKVTDLKGILERNGVKLDFSLATRLNSLFEQSTVTRSPEIDTRKCKELQNFLYGAYELVSVDKVILKDDGSQTITALGFKSCHKLQDIVFKGVWGCDLDFSTCTVLSHDSLMSIINALKDFSTVTIECELDTGPFDNWVTSYKEKYEISDIADSYIEVVTDDYGITSVPISGDFSSAGYSNATHVVFNDSSSFTLFLPDSTTTKTLTLGEDNLAKLTDEEKSMATAKGWTLA